MRKEITHYILDSYPFSTIGNSDMYMQSKNQVGKRHLSHLSYNLIISVAFTNRTVRPGRKGMSSSSGNPQFFLVGYIDQLFAQRIQFFFNLMYILTYTGLHFYSRFVHFVLDMLF